MAGPFFLGGLGGTGTTCCCGSGGTVTVSCGLVPLTLHLSDGGSGTVLMNGIGPAFGANAAWVGCRVVSAGPAILATTPGGVCNYGAPATQSITICYLLLCFNAPTNPQFSLARTWGIIQTGGVTYYCANPSPAPNCAVAQTACNNGQPAPCGTALSDQSQGTGNATSGPSPFSLSVTMTARGSFSLADPVGGNATITS